MWLVHNVVVQRQQQHEAEEHGRRGKEMPYVMVVVKLQQRTWNIERPRFGRSQLESKNVQKLIVRWKTYLKIVFQR